MSFGVNCNVRGSGEEEMKSKGNMIFITVNDVTIVLNDWFCSKIDDVLNKLFHLYFHPNHVTRLKVTKILNFVQEYQ